MYRVTIRRSEGSGEVRDFTVQAASSEELRGRVQSLLQMAQSERGTGPWSWRNPEVWIERAFVGSLFPGDDEVDWMTDAVVQRSGSSPGARA